MLHKASLSVRVWLNKFCNGILSSLVLYTGVILHGDFFPVGGMLDLEKELNQSLFCRIHRSTIVNLKRVRSLQINERGEYGVLLDTGEELRLSRRYRKLLQARLSSLPT